MAGFTRPVASLEYEMIDTYHRFEVPKKGEAKKPIIFYSLGDMDRCGKHGDEGDPSKRWQPRKSVFSKSEIMCKGGRETFVS